MLCSQLGHFSRGFSSTQRMSLEIGRYIIIIRILWTMRIMSVFGWDSDISSSNCVFLSSFVCNKHMCIWSSWSSYSRRCCCCRRQWSQSATYFITYKYIMYCLFTYTYTENFAFSANCNRLSCSVAIIWSNGSVHCLCSRTICTILLKASTYVIECKWTATNSKIKWNNQTKWNGMDTQTY